MTQPFIESTARILKHAVEAYHELKGDKACELACREQIHMIIRYGTNHMPFKPRWSKAVQALADKLGLNVEKLATDRRRMLKAFPPGTVTFEHQVPVKRMMWAIINHPDDAAAIMMSASIVWVTDAENDKLNELGFSKDREDPAEAYRQAGIVLV
jgi:hypothetical protein